MYGYLKKVFLISLIFIAFSCFIYGESYSYTVSFHTQIYNRLRSDGYAPIRQPLASSRSTQFPYNVIINSSNPESTLAIIVDQTFALNHINLIEDLSNYAEIAITVNDESYLPDGIAKDMPAGIRTYISSLQFPTEMAVLVLSTDNSLTDDDCVIVPGADGKLTPYSFFKNVINSLQKDSISFAIKNRFLSLYRLNITDYSKKLSVCLNEGCAALQLNISPEIKNSTLASFVESLQDEYLNTEMDRNINYSFIRIGVKNIIIPEIVSTIILVVMTGIILFFLCGLSFAFGKKKDQHKTEFVKYWLLVPIALAVFTLVFYAAQLTAVKTVANWQNYPVFMIFYKVLLACCYFFIFSLLRHVIKIPCTDFIYGYLLTLTCFINVYIFSAIDLSLLIQFGTACFIAYLSRMTKKTSILIIFTLFIIAPVVFYGVFSISYIQDESLLKISNASFLLNAIFAAIILPFMFMIIRIAVSTGVPGKLPGRKKRILIESITSISVTILIIVTVAIATRTTEPYQPADQAEITERSGIMISSLRKERKKDRTDFEISLSSSYPVIRYDISASSETTMPFYYTDFPYEYSSSGEKIEFLLDENPPTPFILSGSVHPSSSITFTITAYMHNENTLFVEKKTLTLSPGGQ
ncbi:MAG: hypothetical protein K5751_10205 [Treponemataceae bacterium]|nr:hypothetical protein [Treponemataceae bacterium]